MLIETTERNVLTLTSPEISLPVTVIRRPRKTIGIRVRAEGVELVAHPRISADTLQRLLINRWDWIIQHWRLVRERNDLVTRDAEVVRIGDTVLEIVTNAVIGKQPLVAEFNEDHVRVSGEGASDGILVKKAIAQLLRAEASVRFIPRFLALSRSVAPRSATLALSSARTRWGSCTAGGIVRINWRLVQAPLPVLDYVLAHELAHLSHMNHSAHFWQETARLFPAWQPARRWLQQYGHSLFIFG